MISETQSPSIASSQPRKTFAKLSTVLEVPNLIELQIDSFRKFVQEGIKELFEEISPIKDFTGSRLELHFEGYGFGESAEMPQFADNEAFWDYLKAGAKYSEQECRERDMTFAAPLRVRVRLVTKETGEIKEQDIYMGDFPIMTSNGTFLINGAERVVVSQLVRSPGVYFTLTEDITTGRKMCYAKLIPNRGAWLEFETSNKDTISVKIDRKRRIPITTLLRAVGYGSDEELLALFTEVDKNQEHMYINTTISKEPSVTNESEALMDLYRKLRPGDPPTIDNARSLINTLFFNFRRYDLGTVGRYKLNKRLGLDVPLTRRVLSREDLVAIVQRIIIINNQADTADDIDHLGNRRLRAVGELIQNQLRIGMLRMERVVKERMSIIDPDTATPSSLVNIRPVVAAVREFFGGSQLSQFMDQTNPLAELTHKRRLSALGPGGLSRERAGFEVRDVHHSHYGRICPIETPEGPNIGLIGSLATYGRINDYGFIETPYRKVIKELKSKDKELLGRTLSEDVKSGKNMIAGAGAKVTEEVAKALGKLSRSVKVKPFVSGEVVYLSADKEEHYTIAQANAALDGDNQFVDEKVEARFGERFLVESPEKLDFMDVSPKQIVSVSTALIPFLEHDDANRALMGSNMQRQAVPLLIPDAPLVATGMEEFAAHDSGQVLYAHSDSVVSRITGKEIMLKDKDGKEHTYPLVKFRRSNQGTCINQRVVVNPGDAVKKGQVLTDSSSTDRGELALGQNVLCAFMAWEGYNFEDAIVLSERLVQEDKFTSIHIEKHEIEARDTKLGPEEITRDIPNVGEESLRDLDENGIVRVGAVVGPGDILVGKITPKGETELSAEEKLLRAIFGEKAREVKDTSLRVPHGESGKVIDVKIYSRANNDELAPGVNQAVQVYVAQKRKVSEGDKMAGRHGNKGVVAKIVPEEDMPFLPDGTPVEICLNPLGVPSRMNVGQVLETHLGWACKKLGLKVATPVFDGIPEKKVREYLKEAKLPSSGKSTLFDGRTGEKIDQEVVVGYIYMMKLNHLVSHKIHARAVGPYSLVTQQPLGGKAQYGGQRFGEMEVWALEAYGAAHTLQELLTVKSDDVQGRTKIYESLVKGDNTLQAGTPESFNVLIKEIQSLGLDIKLQKRDALSYGA